MFRLLVVTAHPDDEAANFGGTLLHYAARGFSTAVLCLTRGTAATHRGNAKSDQQLGSVRQSEFMQACRVLRVARPEILDYPDGELRWQDFYTVAAHVTSYIRELRPHVILTYGPEGGVTAHTDHAMAGLFTTAAFQWAGRAQVLRGVDDAGEPWRAQKLYYATTLFTLEGRQPISQAPASACINVHEHFDLKIAAFKEHKTQAPLFPMFEEHVTRREHQELFHLAASSTPRKITWETDLFSEVVE